MKPILFFLIFSITQIFSQESKEVKTVEPVKEVNTLPAKTTEVKDVTSNPSQMNSTNKIELDSWKYGGLIRFRPELRENNDFDKKINDQNGFTGQKVQVWLEKDFSDTVKARITLQDARLWGGEKGSQTGLNTANDNTRQSTDIREAWLQVKKPFALPIQLQVGRQILIYGDERLVGSLDWTNVGRSFDGTRVKFENKYIKSHAWVMLLGEQHNDIAGNTTDLGRRNTYSAQYSCPTVTATSNRPCTLAPNSSTEELGDSYFNGFYNTLKISEYLHTDLYYLGVQKRRIPTLNQSIISNPGTPPRDQRMDILHTFGVRITNRTQEDRKSLQSFDYSIEYAVQTGTTGKDIKPAWDYFNTTITQRDTLTGKDYQYNIYKERQKYDSFAFAVDFGYKIQKFRIGAGYDLGSGDPNRNDGKITTFNNLFHTNHIWYGEADLVSWVNMKAQNISLVYDSGQYGKFKIAYFYIDKHKRQDGWYDVAGNLKSGFSTESLGNKKYEFITPPNTTGAGTNQPVSNLGKHLFREIDLIYSIKSDGIDWAFGYSMIFANDAVRNRMYDPALNPFFRTSSFAPQAEFGYIMMTYKFSS
jgi:hypothetical protein